MDPNSTANNSPMKQPAAAVGAVNVNSPGQVAALKGGKLFSAAEKTAAEKAAAEKAAAEKNAEYQPFGDTTRHEGPKFPPPSMVSGVVINYFVD